MIMHNDSVNIIIKRRYKLIFHCKSIYYYPAYISKQQNKAKKSNKNLEVKYIVSIIADTNPILLLLIQSSL